MRIGAICRVDRNLSFVHIYKRPYGQPCRGAKPLLQRSYQRVRTKLHDDYARRAVALQGAYGEGFADEG